jgi:hypothetical protein
MPPHHIRANNFQAFGLKPGGRLRFVFCAESKVLVGFPDVGSNLARFRASLVPAADQQGGNRMLEDELFLCFGFQNDGILIKRADISRKLRAVQQLNSNVLPACKSDVEKRFLNVNY